MKNLIASTFTIALIIAAPASAQLLGGSGGVGGALGGTLGADPIGRTAGSITGQGDIANSTRLDRNIDTRSGKVDADAESSSNANGSLLGTTDLPNRALGSSADGSASSSAKGNASADLIGTDAIRSTTGEVVGATRNAAGGARSTASGAVSNVASRASNAGSLAGSGSAMAMGNLGQLAASGSTAANAGGMFAVEPGMPVQDPKGRVLGHVQSVRQTSAGVVRSVIVEAGSRTAELPAANFAGSGNVLVTAMSKGDIKQASKTQTQAPQDGSNQ